MASPPSTSYLPSLNPKKRPSISSTASQPGIKRPKISSSLRTTSFPASDTAQYTTARSATGSVANSSTSTSKPAPRGRGRPRKSTTINYDDASQAGDGNSQFGKNARSVVSGAGAANNPPDNDGEDQEEDEADISNMLGSTTHEVEEETRQTTKRDRLRTAFNTDQELRFEKWRAVSLRLSALRKIVNQTTSQSVTPAPLQAIQVYGKWYVAEIVERAREVQEEWAVAYEMRQKEISDDFRDRIKQLETELEIRSKDEVVKWTEWERRRHLQLIDRAKQEAKEYVPNPHRGGLLPDHLREALRRFKAGGDGGGTGFEGLSHPLLGLHGNGVWGLGDGATGKRLFK